MFASLDLHFRDVFADFINRAKEDDDIIHDLFADRPEEERLQAIEYLSGRKVITDMDQLPSDDNDRLLYVIPSFPTTGLPFPQIAVYMGPEDSQDFFIGNELGVSRPVVKEGVTVAFDNAKGYYAAVNYRADIIAGTKTEVIWLSKLCQLALAKDMTELNKMDITEHKISVADTKIEQEHFPAIVFSRAVIYTGKALNYWMDRVPVTIYETGRNNALQ